MNMNTESILFEQATRAVRDAIGLECTRAARHPSPLLASGCDGIAHVRFRNRQVSQPYVIRRSLNPSVGHLLVLLRRESAQGLLLVTTHVNDRQAHLLRKAGVHFIDTAGNVFLDAPGLFLWVTGKRTAHTTPTRDRTRAFHPGGIQLLFALLTDRHLGDEATGEALIHKPYRDMCAATGIPRSTIGWVMTDLIRQGFVIETDDGARLLTARKRILEAWVQGYTDRLRPRLLIGRYRPTRGEWWKSARLEGGLWSGEVAAAVLTRELKPGTVTIFGAPPSHAFVLENDLQKDPRGTVEFMRPFWRETATPVPAANCVHPLLVYADLMSIDDERTQEAARTVYDRYLRSIIETA